MAGNTNIPKFNFTGLAALPGQSDGAGLCDVETGLCVTDTPAQSAARPSASIGPAQPAVVASEPAGDVERDTDRG